MNREDVGVGLFVLLDQVAAGCIVAEAAGVDTQHVDGGLALHDPFRQLPARAAGRGDTKAVPFVQPEVIDTPGRAHNGPAVRCVGNGAVVGLFEADLSERRHTRHGGLNMRLQPFDVFLEEFVFRVRVRAVDITGRSALFIGAKDEAAVFLTQVPRTIGLPQHGHLRLSAFATGHQFGVWFHDQELMLHRDHGHIQADHGPRLAGIVAAGGDHVIAGDVAFVGVHHPGAGCRLLDRHHTGLAMNLRAAVPGPAGQCLGQVSRLNITVIGVVNGAYQVVGPAHWPEFSYLVRCQELYVHADGSCGGRVLVIFIHALIVHGQPQIAHLPEAHMLAGFLLQLAVKLDRVLVNLSNAVAHVEQRQQTRCMPGRTTGQLCFFQQDAVFSPALAREVIQRTDADDAAANDDDFCSVFHKCLPDLLRRSRRRSRRFPLCAEP